MNPVLHDRLDDFATISLDYILFSFCHSIEVFGTLLLSTFPNAANTTLMLSNKWGYYKLNHAGQLCFTSVSAYLNFDRATIAELLLGS